MPEGGHQEQTGSRERKGHTNEPRRRPGALFGGQVVQLLRDGSDRRERDEESGADTERADQHDRPPCCRGLGEPGGSREPHRPESQVQRSRDRVRVQSHTRPSAMSGSTLGARTDHRAARTPRPPRLSRSASATANTNPIGTATATCRNEFLVDPEDIVVEQLPVVREANPSRPGQQIPVRERGPDGDGGGRDDEQCDADQERGGHQPEVAPGAPVHQCARANTGPVLTMVERISSPTSGAVTCS